MDLLSPKSPRTLSTQIVGRATTANQGQTRPATPLRRQSLPAVPVSKAWNVPLVMPTSTDRDERHHKLMNDS